MFLFAVGLIFAGLILMTTRRSLLMVTVGVQPITLGLALAFLSLSENIANSNGSVLCFFILLFGFSLILMSFVFINTIHKERGIISVRQTQELKEKDNGMAL